MFRHVFRNSTRTLPLIFTLNSSEAILTLAGLGFLGFGIEPTVGRRVGLRPQQGDRGCHERHLVDLGVPRPRDRARRARGDPDRREPQRPRRPATAARAPRGDHARRMPSRRPSRSPAKNSERSSDDDHEDPPSTSAISQITFDTDGGAVTAVRRCRPRGRPRRGARDRRRVRLGQDGHRPHDPRPAARDRRGHAVRSCCRARTS